MKAIETNFRGRVLLALLVMLALLPSSTLLAEQGGIPQQVAELQQAVATLTSQVHALQSALNSQGQAISALQAAVLDQSNKLQFVTVSGTEMYITGANLNIRDGSGATSGTLGFPYIANPRGLGNLIIGYNENALSPCSGCLPQPMRPRTGSHNLILGVNNGYSSIGGIAAGFANSVNSPYAGITGGAFNAASGMFSVISGGENNVVNNEAASVTGGLGNTASGRFSAVSGGAGNVASNESASVSGGSAGTASGSFSSVSGGTGNTVSAQSSSISGGGFVNVNTQFTWAAGTLHNP
jgi:trimeric autotransporter adhesin